MRCEHFHSSVFFLLLSLTESYLGDDRRVSKIKSFPVEGKLVGLGEGTTQQTFFREEFALMSKPLPCFGTVFRWKSYPFCTPSIGKGTPFIWVPENLDSWWKNIFAGRWSIFNAKRVHFLVKVTTYKSRLLFFFKYIPVLVFCVLLRKYLTAVSVGGCTPRLHISEQPLRQLVKSGDEVVKTTLPWTVNLSTHESETQTMWHQSTWRSLRTS